MNCPFITKVLDQCFQALFTCELALMHEQWLMIWLFRSYLAFSNWWEFMLMQIHFLEQKYFPYNCSRGRWLIPFWGTVDRTVAMDPGEILNLFLE